MNLSSKKEASTTQNKKKRKSVLQEWIDAAVFAVIAATIIRTFIFEAYTIPTPSMEKTLLVNDFLFVNKLSYGPRLPMTPLGVPFTLNTMPLLHTRSYINWPKFGYHRWLNFSKIKRNDVVVFNYPEGDTVVLETEETNSYYQLIRHQGRLNVLNNPGYTIVTRPVDRMENYIKRCVAVAGDTFQVTGGKIYINGRLAPVPPKAQKYYLVATNTSPFNMDRLDELDIDPPMDDYGNIAPIMRNDNNLVYRFDLTKDKIELLKQFSNVLSVQQQIDTMVDEDTFPYDTARFKWSRDNYGPIYIPEKGVAIHLSLDNIALYQRLISVYEHNKLVVKDGAIFINGKKTDQYVFKMNYYWMVGDNRDNSLDSRYWGFVPEDHIVGKAWFIWMSYGRHGLRFKRIFKGIH